MWTLVDLHQPEAFHLSDLDGKTHHCVLGQHGVPFAIWPIMTTYFFHNDKAECGG